MEVDVVVRGDQEAIALIDRLSRRLEDGTPALTSLVDRLLLAERARFAAGGPPGRRWRKLAASTIRRDRSGHRDPRPLILTGALARSLTVRGDPQQIIRVGPTYLTFGTGIWYARLHQRGQGVPRRTIVGLTRVERRGIVDELRRLLIEGR